MKSSTTSDELYVFRYTILVLDIDKQIYQNQFNLPVVMCANKENAISFYGQKRILPRIFFLKSTLMYYISYKKVLFSRMFQSWKTYNQKQCQSPLHLVQGPHNGCLTFSKSPKKSWHSSKCQNKKTTMLTINFSNDSCFRHRSFGQS